MKKVVLAVLVVTALMLSVNLSQATLVSNGGGLVYDTVLDITWYNYTASGSSKTWNQMNDWATNLSITVDGVAITGWRLPITAETAGEAGFGYLAAGEMGDLYYNTLGNFPKDDNHPTNGGLRKRGLMTDLGTFVYWTGTGYSDPKYPLVSYHYTFTMTNGYQGYSSDPTKGISALAVHDGNVGGAVVPIPATILLLAPCIAGLAVVRKKFRR
jgi:hypothetical protein